MALCAALHPHLIRSYRMGRRIAAEQSVGESLIEYLDRAPWGIFILDAHGRVNHFNRTAQTLLSEAAGLTLLGRRLSARATSQRSRRVSSDLRAESRRPSSVRPAASESSVCAVRSKWLTRPCASTTSTGQHKRCSPSSVSSESSVCAVRVEVVDAHGRVNHFNRTAQTAALRSGRPDLLGRRLGRRGDLTVAAAALACRPAPVPTASSGPEAR